MSKVYVSRVAVSMLLKVAEEVLEERLVASPTIVGQELARQVSAHTQREGLGYYPPLEYLQQIEGAIDSDLVDTVQGIAWYVTNLVRSEVQRRLQPAFSNVLIRDIQIPAFAMPAVRPGQLNALHDLATHYTPDRAKVSTELGNVDKQADTDGLEPLARHKVHRWLGEHFESVEITSATVM